MELWEPQYDNEYVIQSFDKTKMVLTSSDLISNPTVNTELHFEKQD